MKCNFYALILLLSIMLSACNDHGEAATKKEDTGIVNEPAPEKKNDFPAIDSNRLIENLQGEWKEIEYPFRRAHFKNKKVKFTEEGVIAPPTFRDFTLSQTCPFEVNNISNAQPSDVFLVLGETKTCEVVKVANDTLIFSGFNVHTNSNYKIVYTRMK